MEKQQNKLLDVIKIKDKGITLIALVITIIVLLILAGVAMVTLTGDNGILTKAGDARNRNIDAEIEEEIRLAWNSIYAESYLNNYTPEQKAEALEKELNKTRHTATRDYLTVTYREKKIVITETGEMEIKQARPQVIAGQKAEKDSEYKSGDYTAIIPAGFTVSATENSIENGLVVKDGDKNEWVWVPVSDDDFSIMFGTASDDGWTLKGTSIKSKYKSLGTTLGERTLSRTNPGFTVDPYYREPDVLTFDTEQTYRTQAGFGDLTEMAIELKNDYKDMMDSVKENKGFYIGRYELGKNTSDDTKPQVKEGLIMNNINWYELYYSCKSFSSGNVQSRMIWGCQWDQVCRYISTLGDNKVSSLDNSQLYGNYSDSTGTAATNKGSLGSPQTTGIRNSAWKTNNIFDFAGNCCEWTQEAYSTVNNGYRVIRGRRFRR